MFGYVLINAKALSSEDRERYSRYYCGVCRALTERYGAAARFTLSYDVTFLALVLSLHYGEEHALKTARCASRFGTKHDYFASDAISYAADMNVILSYRNFEDDFLDDKSLAARAAMRKLERSYEKACAAHPEKARTVSDLLCELARHERLGETNADAVADVSARMLGAMFDKNGDSPELAAFGRALGKFIYILDACIDFRGDLKKKRYNPMTFTSESEFEGILGLLAADCEKKLSELPDVCGDAIVKNVIYSGIWTKYEISKARKK